MRNVLATILSAFALLLAPPTTPAAAQPQPAPQRLRLVVGELPPYAFHVPPPTVAEGGEPQGLVYEVVREAARRIGHPAAVEFMPWPRAQELALTRPDIGILALTRSPEREERHAWVFNVITDDLVLVGGAGVDVSAPERVRDHPRGCCSARARRRCRAGRASPGSSRRWRSGSTPSGRRTGRSTPGSRRG